MFTIFLILFITFVIEVEYNPRIEKTREKDVLLFFNYKDKREFIRLFKIK